MTRNPSTWKRTSAERSEGDTTLPLRPSELLPTTVQSTPQIEALKEFQSFLSYRREQMIKSGDHPIADESIGRVAERIVQDCVDYCSLSNVSGYTAGYVHLSDEQKQRLKSIDNEFLQKWEDVFAELWSKYNGFWVDVALLQDWPDWRGSSERQEDPWFDLRERETRKWFEWNGWQMERLE